MAKDASSPLLGVYLEKRVALLRYFTARLGSAGAAEDLVQDIYLKLADRPDAGQDVANPSAYLYRLGTNLMFDRAKQARRAKVRDQAWRDTEVDTAGGMDVANAPPADEALAAKQRLAAVMAVLDEVSPASRRAFQLHKLEGLTHAETAQAMGLSKSSIEKHISGVLHRLVRRLK